MGNIVEHCSEDAEDNWSVGTNSYESLSALLCVIHSSDPSLPLTMSHLISCTNLSKIYRLGDIDVQALRGVDLSIEHGEFIAIMGSSGSGKSTLMNILGCLDVPTMGSYCLNGRDIAHAETR